ncbi:hypothetical protein [Rugamonas rivuli]|uniref:Uncharacterized protein n=1 Tax=Rugamonas rivuli TaxID=2743358 RepID=A0A843SME2_9BURK|nr:hypothetical protein [Rugamonas rivuli]MQA23241.1 hypothetical protein [Rugamonas rivuli]
MTKSINSSTEIPLDLKILDDLRLLALRTAVDTEARSRGLRFNVGEIGEKLAIAEFKGRSDLPVLAPAPPGTKNIDAISRDGDRYSIKTMQRAKKSGTIYPDREDKDKQLFEYILIVLMREDFTLERIIQLDWNLFCNVRSWDIRMNAWYIARSDRALAGGRQIYPK